MAYLIILLFSCLITYEDGLNRTAVTFEQAESAKSFSSKTPLQSSGKILVMRDETILGHGSGNYFKSGKYKFILTAAHVINHRYNTYIVDGDKLIKLLPVYVDPDRDIAILSPEADLLEIDARTFRVNRSNDLMGKTIYYAGFPQDLGKSLFKNKIKAVNKGANGTFEYTIKEGVNKGKLADSRILKNKS